VAYRISKTTQTKREAPGPVNQKENLFPRIPGKEEDGVFGDKLWRDTMPPEIAVACIRTSCGGVQKQDYKSGTLETSRKERETEIITRSSAS